MPDLAVGADEQSILRPHLQSWCVNDPIRLLEARLQATDDFRFEAALSNGRIFGVELGGPKEGVPDGMKVDRQGNLYVVGPRGIWVWDAAGHHLGTIVVPEQPANLAWGDPGYSTLYITATTSVYKIPTRAHGFIPYL